MSTVYYYYYHYHYYYYYKSFGASSQIILLFFMCFLCVKQYIGVKYKHRVQQYAQKEGGHEI